MKKLFKNISKFLVIFGMNKKKKKLEKINKDIFLLRKFKKLSKKSKKTEDKKENLFGNYN